MEWTTGNLLTKDTFENHSGNLPEWVNEAYRDFESIVTNPEFPCYFGIAGQQRGELRYGYITHNNWSSLLHDLEKFNALFTNQDKLIRHGFFLFVEPEKEEQSLEYYRDYFWKLLQYLHENDRYPWPKGYPKDPEHYLWNFSFAGEPYFAFGNAPAYKQRKTRNLGKSLVIGFQPHRIFENLEGTSIDGAISREKVRKRVEKWDNLPKHPNISYYGDKEHREWKQYFIGDDAVAIEGECPFHPE